MASVRRGWNEITGIRCISRVPIVSLYVIGGSRFVYSFRVQLDRIYLQDDYREEDGYQAILSGTDAT